METFKNKLINKFYEKLSRFRTFLQNRLIFLIQEIFFLFLLKEINSDQTKVLIVRLDAIGDYILFRNFLNELRKSPEFSNVNLTLCGNSKWKQLATKFDSDIIDEFIWIDNNRFYNNIFYRLKKLKSVYASKFGVAIEPTFSREALLGDTVIRSTNAVRRIGSSGDPVPGKKWKRERITNKYYSQIISVSGEDKFEFERNAVFFGKLLHSKQKTDFPSIKLGNNFPSHFSKNEYIILSIGAGQAGKKWSIKNFSTLVNWLLNYTTYDISIIGEQKDLRNATKLTLKSNDRIKNLAGKTNLLELISAIYSSKFVITHDSAVMHISYALKKSFLCISNGQHYKRFHPYPNDSKNIYVYPWLESASLTRKNLNDLRNGRGLNINDIKAERVISGIKHFLN